MQHCNWGVLYTHVPTVTQCLFFLSAEIFLSLSVLLLLSFHYVFHLPESVFFSVTGGCRRRNILNLHIVALNIWELWKKDECITTAVSLIQSYLQCMISQGILNYWHIEKPMMSLTLHSYVSSKPVNNQKQRSKDEISLVASGEQWRQVNEKWSFHSDTY